MAEKEKHSIYFQLERIRVEASRARSYARDVRNLLCGEHKELKDQELRINSVPDYLSNIWYDLIEIGNILSEVLATIGNKANAEAEVQNDLETKLVDDIRRSLNR